MSSRQDETMRLSLSLSLFLRTGTGTGNLDRPGLGIEDCGPRLRIEASGPRQSQTRAKQRSKKNPWLDRPVLPTRSPVVSCAEFESGRVESSRLELSWACLCCTYLLLCCAGCAVLSRPV